MTIFVSFMRVWVSPIVPNGHGAIQSSSVEQIVDEVLALPERTTYANFGTNCSS